MLKGFSLFDNEKKSYIVNSVPEASKESLVVISFHNQSSMALDTSKGSIYSSVVGYMQNDFSYSSTGNYKNLWADSFPDNVITRAISDETQKNLLNYGYATKKTYSAGESPRLNIEFMCYAGDDTPNMAIVSPTIIGSIINNPVAIADILINATLPKVSNNAVGLAESVSGMAVAVGKAVGSLALATKDLALDAMGASGKEPDYAKYASLIGDTLTSHKPPVCSLTIGNIFKKDMMVVKSVEVTFSKEFLKPGVPLFGKYTVSFESLYNAANIIADEKGSTSKAEIFGTGLVVSKGIGSRVRFEDGPQKGNGG